VHQLLEPFGTRRIQRLQRIRVDEKLHAKILIDRRLAFRFSETSHRIQVIRLDAIEIVLRLRVDHPEDSIRVGLPTHVCDPPVVSGDRDALRLLLPACDVLGVLSVGELWGDRSQCHGEYKSDSFHSCLRSSDEFARFRRYSGTETATRATVNSSA